MFKKNREEETQAHGTQTSNTEGLHARTWRSQLVRGCIGPQRSHHLIKLERHSLAVFLFFLKDCNSHILSNIHGQDILDK